MAERTLGVVFAPCEFGTAEQPAKEANVQGVKDFIGATGKISYNGGLFSRNLKILTIRQGKVVEASQAQASSN